MTKRKTTIEKTASQIRSHNLRTFRHNVAILKKKGLISKHVDARKVTPSRNRKLLTKTRKYGKVIRGIEHSFKVTNPIHRKQLLASGAEIVNGRVIIGRDLTYRNGNVYMKGGGKKKLVPLSANFSVDAINAEMKKQNADRIGFYVSGNPGYILFPNAESAVDFLSSRAYSDAQKNNLISLVYLSTSSASQWMDKARARRADKAARIKERNKASAARYREKKRLKKANKTLSKRSRTSRGH